MEHEGRLKRGGGRVSAQAALGAPTGEDNERRVEELVGNEPTPEFVAQVADTCDHLLRLLPDDTLRQVVRLTLEGRTLKEIATQLHFSVATAGRKLNRVRTIWARET